MMTRIFFDTETSGLSPDEHVILSLAMIVEKPSENKGLFNLEYDRVAELDLVIKPTEEEWEAAHPKALEVNGITEEFLEEHGVPLSEARDAVNRFVFNHKLSADKAVLVGQNPNFDIRFLRKYFPSLDWLSFPFEEVVDVISLAKNLRQYDLTFVPENYKGHSISKALGVLEEDAIHTAMGGAEAVRRNYIALRDRFDKVEKMMRKAAQDGEQMPNLFPEVRLVPSSESNINLFSAWANKNDWQEVEPFVFLDPEEFRWQWLGGVPNILVKLSL